VPYHLALLAALAVTFVAAASDWKTGKIPDQLTLGALAAAPLAHAALAFGAEPAAMSALHALALAMLGAAAAGVLPFLLLRAGGMSGGDVKLFLAVGAITGPGFAVHAVTYALVAALAQGLVLIARRKAFRSTGRNVLALVSRPLARGRAAERAPISAMTSMPLAVSIFLGTCAATALLWNDPS
jgi:prepilin peptidase CpaA